MIQNKKILLNFLVIILLTFITFSWTFFIFHIHFDLDLVLTILVLRMLSSFLLYKDYSLSWSKISNKTFLLKSIVYIVPFIFYASYYYGKFPISFLVSELLAYLFSINFLMYSYNFFVNKGKVKKTKKVVIYGAGKAGIKLESEFVNSEYKIEYFCDDDKILQSRSIDNIDILSPENLKKKLSNNKYDLLVIAMPSANKSDINRIYEDFNKYFDKVKILPSIEEILQKKDYLKELKDISVEDLLARHPADLDKSAIKKFINGRKILITGAGGSIGSEISRQCAKYGALELILLDNSEFNLYKIEQELSKYNPKVVMQSVVVKEHLEKTFKKYRPEIVIHAAAYKHVPLVEKNISETILNNVLGTKNVIDVASDFNVKKFVLISTDKAVNPTNVMGATKRICELYAQNKVTNMNISATRFGNVLGSSGSVVPKFKQLISKGKNLTVTHKDVTRYFMLISEACELVLQSGALGEGGEIFILDMGEPVKIIDLAHKMIKLSGRDDINIEITGLRPGEKLYEELLTKGSKFKTKYKSITVAAKTEYDINKLNQDIEELLNLKNDNEIIAKLKEIVPEFNHK